MIDKLEMFIALSNARHFRRAAEECGVTQPTLSAAVKSLEDQLGVQLVWRGARYQGLTPEGQRVLEWARRIVHDARAMRQEMRAAKTGLSGNLRLSVIPTALQSVTKVTTPFRERHPNVRLTILSGPSTDILKQLEDLETDAGITYLGNEPLGSVTTVPLYREQYSFICAADHPFANKKSLTWTEIAAEALALLTPDMQNRRIVDAVFAKAGHTVTPTVEANSIMVLLSHVTDAGLGTVLPLQSVAHMQLGAQAVAIPLSEPDTDQLVGLIAPHREPHTPVLDALLKVARSVSEG